MPSKKPERVIALTGATGFVGSHVLDQAVNAGHAVRALTRRPQEPRHNVAWIEGDIHDIDALARLVEGARHVVHGAGVVKAGRAETFHAVNAEGVRNLCRAMKRAGAAPESVMLISSLAAREPELSPYARSKREGERALMEVGGDFPWAIVRPPAVYGPRDTEILKLFRAMKRGFAPAAGRESRFSLIHAADLAALVLAALGHERTLGKTLEPDDAKQGGYTIAEVAEAASKILGRPVRTVEIHPGVLKGVALVNEFAAPLIGDVPILTRHKVREMAHPDWVAAGGVEKIVPRWRPERDLETGLAETFEWYRRQGWL